MSVRRMPSHGHAERTWVRFPVNVILAADWLGWHRFLGPVPLSSSHLFRLLLNKCYHGTDIKTRCSYYLWRCFSCCFFITCPSGPHFSGGSENVRPNINIPKPVSHVKIPLPFANHACLFPFQNVGSLQDSSRSSQMECYKIVPPKPIYFHEPILSQ